MPGPVSQRLVVHPGRGGGAFLLLVCGPTVTVLGLLDSISTGSLGPGLVAFIFFGGATVLGVHLWSRTVELVVEGHELVLRWSGGLAGGAREVTVPLDQVRGVEVSSDGEGTDSLNLVVEAGTVPLQGWATSDDYQAKATRIRAFLDAAKDERADGPR